MAKPKYKVTAEDSKLVLNYLLSQLESPNYDVRKPGAQDFKRYLDKVTLDDPSHDAVMLS